MKKAILFCVFCLFGLISISLAAKTNSKQFHQVPIEPIVPIYASGEHDSDPPVVGTYDFGLVKKSKTKKIDHIFVLRNASSRPASVDAFMPTCECVSSKPASASQTLPKTLKPAELFKIKMSVDLSKVTIGPAKKEIWGFTNGNHKRVAVILRFTGTVVK
jgi:hypothetical protein